MRCQKAPGLGWSAGILTEATAQLREVAAVPENGHEVLPNLPII